ncbi:MAG TPA: hypothetical protein VGX94_03870 [Terriglobia bacterium]|nr:hypothetical protein [Terriglobia bacterium]
MSKLVTRKQFLYSLAAICTSGLYTAKLEAHQVVMPNSLSHYAPVVNLEGTAQAVHLHADDSSIAALSKAVLEFPHAVDVPAAARAACSPRISAAEKAYFNLTHPGVREDMLAAVLNDIATELGAPSFAQTSSHQLRVTRMRLLLSNPVFMGFRLTTANAKPGDSINPHMSPLQAVHLSLTMADQKMFNPDYQYEPSEWEVHYRQHRAGQLQRSLMPRTYTVRVVASTNRKSKQLVDSVNKRLAQMTSIDMVLLANRSLDRLDM